MTGAESLLAEADALTHAHMDILYAHNQSFAQTEAVTQTDSSAPLTVYLVEQFDMNGCCVVDVRVCVCVC